MHQLLAYLNYGNVSLIFAEIRPLRKKNKSKKWPEILFKITFLVSYLMSEIIVYPQVNTDILKRGKNSEKIV